MPSSSLFLRSSATLISVLTLFSARVWGQSSLVYSLDTQYSGSTFFNGFDFFTTADPTHGFVTYVNQSTAQSGGLISAGSTAYIGVDYTHTYNGSAAYYNINGVGRPSVRLTSQKAWTHGLFLADIAHMPGGICGTWPAFWTLGPNWPYNGEIDIIEGANNINYDVSSAHTGSTCTLAATSGTFTGALQGTDCDEDSGSNTVGCGFDDQNTQSYGTGFNSNGGGVYAMEWTSSYIKIWFFTRSAIPSDISSGNSPKPSGWGTPDAIFNGPSCNIDSNFASHNIVIDNTFCGDWAGATWSDSGGCAAATGQSSCSVYVGSNPSAFKNAYWTFNSVKVFQAQSSSTTASTTATTSSSTTLSTSIVSTTSSSATSSSVTTTSTTISTTASTTTSSPKTSSTTSATTSSKPASTTTSSVKTTTSSSKITTTSSKTTTSSSKSTTRSTTTSRRFGIRAAEPTGVEESTAATRHRHARSHVHGHVHGHGDF